MKRIVISFFFLLYLLLASAQEKKDTSSTFKRAGVGVELALNTCFGGASNNSGDAELSNLSYGSMIKSSAKTDSITYHLGGGLSAGFDLALMFGKKRTLGFSVGAMITAGFNSFTANNFETEYKATDAEGRSFKRILSAPQWKEKVAYTSISLPLLFKLRYYWKKKLGIFADIGPVITVFSNAKSRVETALDFEAVYSMDGGTPHYSEQSASTDWSITRDMVNKHSSISANDYFNLQYNRGYYVGLDKTLSADAPVVNYKIGFGSALRAGLMVRVNSIFTVALGGQCLITSSGRKSSASYKPVDVPDDFEQGQKINSILNSTGSLLKAQYGVNIGFYIKVAK